MLKITFQDGSALHVAESATLITNKGPLQADQVFPGYYIRCGLLAYCYVTTVETL